MHSPLQIFHYKVIFLCSIHNLNFLFGSAARQRRLRAPSCSWFLPVFSCFTFTCVLSRKQSQTTLPEFKFFRLVSKYFVVQYSKNCCWSDKSCFRFNLTFMRVFPTVIFCHHIYKSELFLHTNCKESGHFSESNLIVCVENF